MEGYVIVFFGVFWHWSFVICHRTQTNYFLANLSYIRVSRKFLSEFRTLNWTVLLSTLTMACHIRSLRWRKGQSAIFNVINQSFCHVCMKTMEKLVDSSYLAWKYAEKDRPIVCLIFSANWQPNWMCRSPIDWSNMWIIEFWSLFKHKWRNAELTHPNLFWRRSSRVFVSIKRSYCMSTP